MASTCELDVQKFFDKHGIDGLQCKECKSTMKRNPSSHLRRFHPSLLPANGSKLQSNVNKALVKMICLELQPLGMVENSAFKDYTYQLNPNYTLPSTEMLLDELLLEQYNQAKDATIKKLQGVDSIAVSTDLWSSDSGKKFLTLTTHFIVEAKYETLTLSTKEITGAYTSENIANKIREALEKEWKIFDKVVCITTNDLPMLRTAVIDILQKLHHSCVAHAISRTFSAIESYFKGTPLEKILELYWDEECPYEIVSILKPLRELTTIISAEQYPTLSCIIPLVSALQEPLKNYLPCTKAATNLKTKLMKTIEKNLGCYETNKTAAKATLMDPRFKKIGFGSPENSDSAQDYVVAELNKLEYCDEGNPLPSASSSDSQLKKREDNDGNLWNHLDKKVPGHLNTEISSATSKVKQYVEQPYLDRKSDPLKFWEDRKLIDSGLYKMSQKYLCIPATSVPAERVFSKAGLLCKQRISRLESDKIDQILFLNSFLSAEKK